jgi:hypothetical protein
MKELSLSTVLFVCKQQLWIRFSAQIDVDKEDLIESANRMKGWIIIEMNRREGQMIILVRMSTSTSGMISSA